MRHQLPVYRIQLNRAGSIPGVPVTYDGPADAAKAFRTLLGDPDREHLLAIYLDIQRKVTGVHLVGVGASNILCSEAREVFGCGILLNAADVVLVHNHPSGDPSPSEADEVRTRELEFIGLIIGMTVLDHVVVGERDHQSIRATGRMLLSQADAPELTEQQLDIRMRKLLGLPEAPSMPRMSGKQ